MSDYKFVNQHLVLPEHDSDLTVVLPNGLELTIQYRTENQSTDICFSKNNLNQKCIVNVFNADLSDAKRLKGKNCLLGEQILIGLPKED